jgi:hypothetical protein
MVSNSNKAAIPNQLSAIFNIGLQAAKIFSAILGSAFANVK